MTSATLTRPSLAERYELEREAAGLLPGEYVTVGTDGTRYVWSLTKGERARLDAMLRTLSTGRTPHYAPSGPLCCTVRRAGSGQPCPFHRKG